MVQQMARFVLWLLGWKLMGEAPKAKKYVLIVAPHTSNWDFFYGMLGRHGYGLKAYYLGKAELFRFPYGWLFRALGGYPVDRSKRNHMVDSVVDLFNQKETFAMAVAPEGTRKRVPKLRTGFYYIALKAQIPIFMAGMDYARKEIHLHPEPIQPSGEVEADMQKFRSYYEGFTGKIPQNSFTYQPASA